jgi:RNA polymerase sigma factor (sigma-70 family)
LDLTTERQRLSLALQRVAAGDKPALRQVYDQTSAKLFGVCLRILGDRTEAEDVLQDVYVTVWSRAGSFDPERGVSPITWLATLARNRAVDRLRASKGHLNRPLELAAEAPDPAPAAVDVLEQSQERQRLATCLGELEPDHAGYIRAAFFDGHTYASLAEGAGVPLGTMKSWIRRALMRLRACLEP